MHPHFAHPVHFGNTVDMKHHTIFKRLTIHMSNSGGVNGAKASAKLYRMIETAQA